MGFFEGKQSQRVRGLAIGIAALLTLVVASGVAQLFATRTDPLATQAANDGAVSPPTELGLLERTHDDLGALILLVLLIGIAWIMLRVLGDWSPPLALSLVLVVVAGFTGFFIGYQTVMIDGVFADQRGVGFLFDSDFDGIQYSTSFRGASAYRFFFALHLVSSVALVPSLIRALRSLERPDTRDDMWENGKRRRPAMEPRTPG